MVGGDIPISFMTCNDTYPKPIAKKIVFGVTTTS